MRVKKSDLRAKGLPQLPINYPGPDVVEFDYEKEKARVENLCKRLADSEVEVRDAVLDDLPRYIKEICEQYDARPLALKDDSSKKDEKKKMTRKERLEARIEAQRRNFQGLDEDELTLVLSKLCLGIFYCYWHSDKPLVQHECAAKISRLIHYPVTPDHKITMLRCLLRILSKNWTKIDQWRMDKYMSLVRKILFEVLRLIQHLRTTQEGTKVVQTKLVRGGADDAASTTKRSKRGREAEEEENAVAAESKTATMKKVEETVYDLTLQRIVKVFQDEVVDGIAAGLTMHLSDIFLSELIHAKVTHVPLFLALAKGIPIHVMQRGNNVEKRVIDHFFVPIAAGQLDKLDPEVKEGEAPLPVDERVSIQIARQLAQVAKDCSTSRETTYAVRPNFSECQLYLQHYLDQQQAPEMFEPENTKDKRIKMKREIEVASSSNQGREVVAQRKAGKKAALLKAMRDKGMLKSKGTTRRKKVR